MEQIGNELKKVLKAGLGAVAAGAEMAQDAIETLSKKGEPLYQQAKSAVTGAADKIRQAVNDSGIKDAMCCKPQVQEIIDDLRALTPEDWAQVRAALDEFEAAAKEAEEVSKADDAPEAEVHEAECQPDGEAERQDPSDD